LRRNSLLKHVIEGKIETFIEVTGRHRRKRKQLVDDFNEMARYWKLKGETLNHTMWGTHFGRAYGHVVRQTRENMKFKQKFP
jgi:hypothetical protein